jgi:hypothetical protein
MDNNKNNMYLIAASIVAATYFSLKWLSIYKKPKEWKNIPTIPAFGGLYQLFTNPQTVDVSFEKDILPYTKDVGVATVMIQKPY